MTASSPLLRVLKRPVVLGWLVFSIMFLTVAFVSYQRYQLFNDARTRELTNAAMNARERLQSVLNYSLSATKTLAFIVTRYEGKKDFNTVAKELLDSNRYIDALELVEDGTITQVYPFEENKAAIGYDILRDPRINKEAMRAIRESRIFFAGPFMLKQGYIGIVGRQPLFSKGRFRGFAASIIKLPTLIKAAELDKVYGDYIFRLSKIDPNTGKEQFFLPYGDPLSGNQWSVVSVTEGDWRIYAGFAKSGKLGFLLPFSILGVLFAACAGLFTWYGAQQPYRLERQVKEKTRQLEASEEKYFSFFEQASDTIMVTDEQGFIVEVNQSLCNLLEYTREELIGMNYRQLTNPEQWPQRSAIAAPGEQPETRGSERRMRKKNGSMAELEVSVKKIDDHHTLAIGRDVTGLREAQKRIALSESTLRGAFEYSAIGTALVAPDGRWLKVNKALSDILGYTREELLTMSFNDITHPDDQEAGRHFLTTAANSDTNLYHAEKRYISKSGEVIWVNLNVSSVRDAQGRLQYFVTQAENINEKKNVTEQLQVREEQLRLFIEHSPAALAMFDKEMRYIVTSKRWLKDYSLEGKEVLGRVHYDLFPDNPQRWRDIHQQGLKGVVAESEEDFYIDEKGKIVWLRWAVHPWRQYNGEIGGIILFTEVITQLKEAEMKFRNLVEQSLTGVCIIQHGKFAYVNPRFAEIFGYDPQQMIYTMPAISLMPAEQYIPLEDNTSAGSATAASVRFEATGTRKNGEVIFLEVYDTVTTYEGSKATIRTLLDITERKKAEEEIRESEEKFRNLVEKSLSGIYIMQDNQVKYINPAHQRIMGYSLEELQAFGNIEAVVEKGDIPVFRANHHVGKTSGNRQSQHRLKSRRKDGSLAYLEVTTSTITYEGKPAVIGTMLDITGLVENEIRIGRAVTDAQERERMQIGMELHDNVKQILAASLLTLDFVRSNLSDSQLIAEPLQHVKEYTAEAIDELRRLSHQLAPSVEKNISFREQMEKLIALMNPEKKIPVILNLRGEDLAASAEVRLAFYRIVQEQLSNIIKYANATSIWISFATGDNDIVLTIKDDGQGFDTSLARDGIGLENIKRRAFVLGGTSTIISSPGNGCKITVTIPVKQDQTGV
ncbi:PAS domain S-box protein [Nostoc ellipsosporum NOK]|nr:PAS domain S-box protein [Nostoc ellipsosporum NOK]